MTDTSSPDSPSPLRPDDRIGPYRVERPLGQGGMGEVVVAYDDRLDRRVAIKRIRHEASTDSSGITAADRERLRREARAAASLSHPAIVQIHDILSDGTGGDAIVMELIEGQSVAQRLKDGPLPLPEALRVARQVAEGLAEAHRVGLVHRDLKAENVMLTPPSGDHPGRAKILDFGLAKHLSKREIDDSLTEKGAILGTVRAMSPEQAEGREVDHRSDLFSLGVLLYELLTGQSPFRGASAVDTLRKVLLETPRPMRELRPAVSEELESLVSRLLVKKADRRLADAGAVARRLAELTQRLPTEASPFVQGDSESLGDAPTGSFVSSDSLPPTEDFQPRALDRSEVSSKGRHFLVAGIAMLGIFAVLAAVWLQDGRSEPLRVVVPRPEIQASELSEELELVASGVLVAALATLTDLRDIVPVEPDLIGTETRSAVDVARSVAADEVLSATIESQSGKTMITLRRISGTDGEVRWVKAFEVPRRRSGAQLVGEAVTVHLLRAYAESSLRRDVQKRRVSDADYAAFVEIFHRIDSGKVPLEPELEKLEKISERAPNFMAAHLRGAAIAWRLYSDTRNINYLGRGAKLITRARQLAPRDPLPIFWTFRIALDQEDRPAAEIALQNLIDIAPHDLGVLLGRASLAERDGDLGSAVLAMRSVVERWPSWNNLHRLADLELRRGDVDEARQHLEQMIARVPANTWGLAKLAELELFYGDLERAETLFLKALALKPHRSYFTNLGLARFLGRRYQAAKASYLEALARQPDHLVVRLNLADTELALGEVMAAQARYLRILEELERQELDAAGKMRMAQCLARLGEDQRAVALTLETLQQHPEDAEVVYSAALVYSLVGETHSAWVNVEKALAKGVQPRWFKIPGFVGLAADPRFSEALDAFGKSQTAAVSNS